MAKASSLAELNDLHRGLTKVFKRRLDMELDEDPDLQIPMDGASLGSLIKFLKDNEVTADPADKDDLNEMREALKNVSAERKKRGLKLVEQAEANLLLKEG